MRLSTRARYAVRAVLDLAMHGGQDPVQIKDIARREEISRHYVEVLFVRLRREGVLRSVRGPRGGYLLARSADKISIGDIVRVVEGPITLVPCLRGPRRGKPGCPRARVCVVRDFWRHLSGLISRSLNQTTVADLQRAVARRREALATESSTRRSRPGGQFRSGILDPRDVSWSFSVFKEASDDLP
jgi:Rrf2 family iron-sulfur cluster assembly transcriptional regulator